MECGILSTDVHDKRTQAAKAELNRTGVLELRTGTMPGSCGKNIEN
jgi:hypothetical protein